MFDYFQTHYLDFLTWVDLPLESLHPGHQDQVL